MIEKKTHLWCVECGHACHCASEGECFFWEPGKFRNSPAWEWCQHKPCVHGQPGDLAECKRCGAVSRYDEAWKHDCRPVAAAQKIQGVSDAS